MKSDALLEVRGLSREFRLGHGWPQRGTTLRAVDNVDLEIRRGEIFGIVGESGSGKSTLARLLLRLIEPTRGAIRFDGQDLLALSRSELRRARRRFQMVFQDPYASLNPRWTVRSILAEPLRAHGRPRDEWRQCMDEALDTTGLPFSFLSRYPHELSGGQRQRLNIARALIPGPDLLVGDEPVAALDVSIQAQILNLLLDLQRDRGLTLVFIGHDLAVVKAVSHRIGVMSQGRMVEVADAGQLFRAPQHPYTRQLLSAVPRLPARAS